MNSVARFCLICCLLLITAHRLPAPITEETTPTPSPAQLPKAEESFAYAWPGEKYPVTRIRLLNTEDVAAWDAEKLRYVINEIYARGGYDFRIPEIKQIFLQFS